MSNFLTYCHIHHFPFVEECSHCVNWFNAQPPVDSMTARERVAEVEYYFSKQLFSKLTVKFSRIHDRLNELCGCTVLTHQLSRPDYVKSLAADWSHTTTEVSG